MDQQHSYYFMYCMIAQQDKNLLLHHMLHFVFIDYMSMLHFHQHSGKQDLMGYLYLFHKNYLNHSLFV